ncbi:hypothetical protein [Neptuniibacter caesariensis]|uniref:Lipoprotein n=1 Tax=Neptuniibacter caesariensis TaxID=207954 RepID=A0A7U8C7K2_NEPCE|nr:hypothetical protein [Neptuniibacter caesariensis]EAR63032.1 hypothetical protein MED92_07931 [Oceanospirillum sp. MED92] [Neptuniibacter caesariensis]
MLRKGLLLITAMTLTGCLGLDTMKSDQGTPKDTSYYLIDTKYKYLCLGNTSKCKDMTKIVSAQDKFTPIEQAYGKPIAGPNYPISLIRMLLNPQDGSYQSTQQGTTGRLYRIPRNEMTQTVWRTLEVIERDLYN